MRYDTDGFINRLPGNRWACHAAIASPYSDASRFSSSKLAPHERAAIKSFFFCRAVEISPAYVAVAIERWHVMTGQEPELITAN